MSSLPALLAQGRVVTVCCGDHRPALDCLCCCECPTGASVAELDPAIRALLAHDKRERTAALRLTMRRAFHAVTVMALNEHLADLVAATNAAVRVRVFDDLPHFEGSLTCPET